MIALFIFVFTIVTLSGLVLKDYFLNANFYVENIVTDKYVEEVVNSIDKRIKAECFNIEVSGEKVVDAISKRDITELSRQYISGVFRLLLEGKPYEEVTFESPEIKKIVRTDLKAFGKVLGIKVPKKDIEDVTNKFNTIISEEINAIQKSYIDGIVPFANKLSSLKWLTNLLLPFVVFFLLICVACIFAYRKSISNIFFFLIMPMWLAITSLYIPMNLIKGLDLPSKTVFSESIFKIFVDAILYSLTDGITKLFFTVFCIFTVILVVGMIFVIEKKIARYRNAELDNLD